MLKLNFVEGFIINFNSGKARESQISYLSSLTSKTIFFSTICRICANFVPCSYLFIFIRKVLTFNYFKIEVFYFFLLTGATVETSSTVLE